MVRKMEMAKEMEMVREMLMEMAREMEIAEGMGDREIKNRKMKYRYSFDANIFTQPVSICNANRILQQWRMIKFRFRTFTNRLIDNSLYKREKITRTYCNCT